MLAGLADVDVKRLTPARACERSFVAACQISALVVVDVDMASLDSCPRCGRDAKLGITHSWFPVHTCRGVSREVLQRSPLCAGQADLSRVRCD